MVGNTKLFYVFTFSFSEIPLNEQIFLQGGQYSLGSFLINGLESDYKTHYVKVDFHKSEEGEHPTARSALYIPFSHLSIFTKAEKVELKPFGKGIMKCHLALFESGMGVIWIILAPDEDVDSSLLTQITRRDKTPLIAYTSESTDSTVKTMSIHDIFNSEVEYLLGAINHLLDNLSESIRKTLHKRLSNINFYRRSKAKLGLSDVFKVVWIDKDEELIWHDSDVSTRSCESDIFQEPSLAILYRISVSDGDVSTIDLNQWKAVQRLVLSILHATPTEFLDEVHGSKRTSMPPRNLYPDKRFRTFLSSNCVVVVHSEDDTSPELKGFMGGLFRTYCAVRGCWHMYNIINEQLDRSVRQIMRRFNEIISAGVVEVTLSDALTELVETRGFFLMSLAVEDPLVRGVRLTDFGHIYDEASYFFRLRELRARVEHKILELDRLCDVITSHELRLRHLSAVSVGKGSRVTLFAIIFMILAVAFLKFFPVYLGLPWDLSLYGCIVSTLLALGCLFLWLYRSISV